MKPVPCIFLVCCLFGFCACSSPTGQQTPIPEGLRFDHILLFVPDKALEDSLRTNLFTPADKLTTRHDNQGTRGQYYLFYNTYIEFLYLEDSTKARANERRFKSAYTDRWADNGTNCPIAFGLALEPFDAVIAGTTFEQYASPDAPEGEFYLMSPYNRKPDQPLLYVSMPHRAFRGFDALEEIDQRVEAYKRADLKNYLTHPGGMKKLTGIELAVPKGITRDGNLDYLMQLPEITVVEGPRYALTLTFDDQAQGKTFRTDGHLPVTVNY